MRKKLEITERELGKFAGYLRREERGASTIEAYHKLNGVPKMFMRIVYS